MCIVDTEVSDDFKDCVILDIFGNGFHADQMTNVVDCPDPRVIDVIFAVRFDRALHAIGDELTVIQINEGDKFGKRLVQFRNPAAGVDMREPGSGGVKKPAHLAGKLLGAERL